MNLNQSLTDFLIINSLKPSIGTQTLPMVDGTIIHVTDDPDDPFVDLFYDGFDKSFVLPCERQTLSGFKAALALNRAPYCWTMSAVYGAYREVVLVLNSAAGELMGGANFVCFPIRSSSDTSWTVSMNLNYIYVLPPYRGDGHFYRLLSACERVARDSFNASLSADAPLLMFLEKNDPCRLSPERYALDAAGSGIDPLDRLRLWSRTGARIIDFRYIQPSLGDGIDPDYDLILSVRGAAGDSLDSKLLYEHLARFLGISIIKSVALSENQIAYSQLRSLLDSPDRKIALLDPSPWLSKISPLGGVCGSVQEAIALHTS